MFSKGLLSDTVVIAWHAGKAITARQLLEDAVLMSKVLEQQPGDVINLANNRYLFSVVLVAASLNNKTTLLPQDRAPNSLSTLQCQYAPTTTWSDSDIERCIGQQRGLGKRSDGWKSFARDKLNNGHFNNNQVAFTTFTSGSTGKPKPQNKVWLDLYTQLTLLNQRLFPGKAGVNILSTVPAQHVYGLELSILLSLFFGHGSHSGRPFFPVDICSALKSMPSPRVLVTVPLHLRACVESNISWPKLDLIISATAPLEAGLAKKAEVCFAAPLTEVYGSTEVGGIATRRPSINPVWKPLTGVNISLCSQTQQAMVQAPHLKDATPLHDHVELLEDGFKLLARQQDMVKIAGKRAALSDLNMCLLNIDGIKDGVFILPKQTTNKESRLAALVVAPTLKASSIMKQLSRYMDPVFLPRPLLMVDQLPRTDSGKITHRQAMSIFNRELEGSTSSNIRASAFKEYP